MDVNVTCSIEAPNGQDCLDGTWDAQTILTIVLLSIAMAVLIYCQRGHRQRFAGWLSNTCCGTSLSDHPSSPPHGVFPALPQDMAGAERRQWLLYQWPLEMTRSITLILIALKLADDQVLGIETNDILESIGNSNLPWVVIWAASSVLDIWVVIALIKCHDPSIFQKRLLYGYTLTFGFPFGSILKILLLIMFERSDWTDSVKPISYSLGGIISLAVVLSLMRLATVEWSYNNFSSKTEWHYRPWYISIGFILMIAYFTFALVALAQSLFVFLAERVARDQAGFEIVSNSTWFGLLLPVWSLAFGTLLACVLDAVFQLLAVRAFRILELQRKCVRIIPLFGALCFAIGVVHAYDHRENNHGFVRVGIWYYILLILSEIFGLANMFILTIRVLCQSESEKQQISRNPVNDDGDQVSKSLHIPDPSAIRGGSITMQRVESPSLPQSNNDNAKFEDGQYMQSNKSIASQISATIMNPSFDISSGTGTDIMFDERPSSRFGLDEIRSKQMPSAGTIVPHEPLFSQSEQVTAFPVRARGASNRISTAIEGEVTIPDGTNKIDDEPFSKSLDGPARSQAVPSNDVADEISATSSLAAYLDDEPLVNDNPLLIANNVQTGNSLFSMDGNSNRETPTASLPSWLHLSKDTVQIGMCVMVDAKNANPQLGLFGDTVSCNGLAGVVAQWDNSHSCKLALTDGRHHWVQCQALIQIPDPTSSAFTGFSEQLSNDRGTLMDLSTALISKHGHHSNVMANAIRSIECGNVDSVRETIEQLAPGEIDSSSSGMTLLQRASRQGHLDIVTLLLNKDADPNIPNPQGTTALHCSVFAENREDGAAVAVALLDAGASINHQDYAGYGVLHLAAQRGHAIMAEVLVALSSQRQVQFNLRVKETSDTPLHCAIRSQTTKIVKLLVEQGACDINSADGNGDTALHLAFTIAQVDDTFVDVAKYLLLNGANGLAKNQQGEAALDLCPDIFFDDVKQVFIAAQVQNILAGDKLDSTIAKGCRVRIRPEVMKPTNGFQGVSHEDELVVRSVDHDSDEVSVTFVDPNTFLIFKLSEVYRVFDNSGTVLTASSTEHTIYNMFNPDQSVHWQSDGERGQHWFCIRLPHVGELICCEIHVNQGGVAYIPKRVEVHTGETMETLTPFSSTEVVSYGWSAVVPNEHQVKCRFIKVLIRSCHESGINCRISGLRLMYSFQGETIAVPSSVGEFEPLAWEDVNIGHETGKILKGRYKLGRKIARGGFGITYMATDEDCFNEQVLIKFLHRLPGLELFRREARRLLDINHPQIPRLKAYFELKDDSIADDVGKSKFALVMEMIHGRNLVDILDDEGPWDEKKTVSMLTSVLGVLTHVHRKGIVHRDVKAANIMRRDADGVYFVIDFGACATTADDGISRVIGTPGYMAPEATHGKNCCESDLFSLGVLGLYMLTGIEPYMLMDKTHPAEPFKGALKNLTLNNKLGASCHDLLEALLKPDPNSRRLALNAIGDQ